MRWKFMPYFYMVVMICSIVVARPASAEDAKFTANNAVTSILFEYDADEFATYKIGDDGFLDIIFARNTPDPLYSEILNKLRKNPDIKGVLAGKTGPTCPLFVR